MNDDKQTEQQSPELYRETVVIIIMTFIHNIIIRYNDIHNIILLYYNK